MAENKKSFIMYCDLIHTVSKMPDDKAGQLFKHILAYTNDLNPITDDLIIELTFEPIRQQLKRDLRKWDVTSSQRAESGRLGGKKSGEARRKQKEANEANASPLKQNEHDNVNDNVNDNVIIVYNAYPSKCIVRNVSNGKCDKNKAKIKELLKKYSVEQLLLITTKYIDDCKSNNVFMKNFGTFLNNLPIEFLNEPLPITKEQVKELERLRSIKHKEFYNLPD